MTLQDVFLLSNENLESEGQSRLGERPTIAQKKILICEKIIFRLRQIHQDLKLYPENLSDLLLELDSLNPSQLEIVAQAITWSKTGGDTIDQIIRRTKMDARKAAMNNAKDILEAKINDNRSDPNLVALLKACVRGELS